MWSLCGGTESNTTCITIFIILHWKHCKKSILAPIFTHKKTDAEGGRNLPRSHSQVISGAETETQVWTQPPCLNCHYTISPFLAKEQETEATSVKLFTLIIASTPPLTAEPVFSKASHSRLDWGTDRHVNGRSWLEINYWMANSRH